MPGQVVESRLGIARLDRDRPRRGARGLLLPFGQFRKQPAFVDRGLGQPFGDHRRPGPAQPVERLRRGPGSLPLGPVRGVGQRQHRLGGAQQERRDLGIVGRQVETGDAGDALWRRHRKLRRAQERIEFEQVESRQIGIAQTLADQRGVEQDDGGIGSDPDRFATPDPARLAALRDPDAAMAGVKGGVGKHVADRARCGTNWQPRRAEKPQYRLVRGSRR